MTRQMLQPPKDQLRQALDNACDLIVKLKAEVAYERSLSCWQRFLRWVRR